MREGKDQKGDSTPLIYHHSASILNCSTILTQKNGFHAGTENATSASSVSKHSILLRSDKEKKCGDKHSCGQK